ncbi:MAG: GH32 C-terminal domain-containing protein [Planctomycetota bacterium]|nr:GH32 C-terminal domain-containing protein [Planctomycetota bacterium]
MTFPTELTLKTFPDGIRLCREPVREIETLRGREHRWAGVTMKPGKNIVVPTKHDLFDVEVDVKLGDVSEFCLFIQGHPLRYNVAGRKFLFLNREVHTHSPSGLAGGRLQFRLLIDRTSVELFHAGGKATASCCYLPEARDWPLEFYLYDGSAKIVSLRVHELRSIWK